MILSPVWFKSEGLLWIITKDLWLVPGAPSQSSHSTAQCTGEAENQLPASFGAASVLGGSPWTSSGFLSSPLFHVTGRTFIDSLLLIIHLEGSDNVQNFM